MRLDDHIDGTHFVKEAYTEARHLLEHSFSEVRRGIKTLDEMNDAIHETDPNQWCGEKICIGEMKFPTPDLLKLRKVVEQYTQENARILNCIAGKIEYLLSLHDADLGTNADAQGYKDASESIGETIHRLFQEIRETARAVAETQETVEYARTECKALSGVPAAIQKHILH